MVSRFFKIRTPHVNVQKELSKLPDGTLVTLAVPAESWTTQPTQRLFDLVSKAILFAGNTDHSDIAAKMKEYPHWPTIWPGEHYRLLTGIVQAMQPKLIVEIGTATGYSMMAMKKVLPPGSRLITFDIVPWQKVKNCILTESDFSDGSVEQIIGDLTDDETFKKYTDLLTKADFVFIDAAKDGKQEKLFIDKFKSIEYDNAPIFMFDDIKMMNMVHIWHSIDMPKWDISSVGHWSGTGLVDWTNKKPL